MEIKIDLDEIKKKKLFVASPMYGGQCSGLYAQSLMSLGMACTKYDIDFKFQPIYNESLITRARNYCVDEFLRSDSTHLLFIDSDIGFNFRDAITLLHFCNSAKEYGVVTATYPKKSIDWDNISLAVKDGRADGDKGAKEIHIYGADLVFNALHKGEFKIDEPLQIGEAGTGFMMIHRDVFTLLDKKFKNLKYKPDHVTTEHFNGKREISAYFDCRIDPNSKRYLSEDYNFCHMCRKIGIDIWMLPWISLAHIGSYTFVGNIPALASLQQSVETKGLK